MVSEVESSYSKKCEVGNAELKANGLGFAGRVQSPLPSPPRSLRNLKRKPLPQKAGANYIARYTCQISSANLAEIP